MFTMSVVPLTVDSQGDMRLAGAGETIDWLVKMRRLPADLMLDQAIANRTVSAADARKSWRAAGKVLYAITSRRDDRFRVPKAPDR